MKEGPSESKENKENREKKGEREASKGHGAANRKGKGASRSRQGMESKPPMNLNVVQSPLSSLSVSCYIILLLMWFLFSLSFFLVHVSLCTSSTSRGEWRRGDTSGQRFGSRSEAQRWPR